MARALTNWKIDASRFYPFGLSSHSSALNKCAVVVWSDHSVYSLLFLNGFSAAVQNNLPPTKTFKANEISNHIVDLAIGTLETVILTANGAVQRFASNKRLATIDHLQGVRCVCATRQGFAMICLSADGSAISLQKHAASFTLAEDVAASRTFDISFGRNYCQSTWSDSRFVIKEIVFAGTNRYFWKSLQVVTTKTDKEYIFFAIDNVLFVLVEQNDGDDYDAHIIDNCSSKIVNFWQSCNEEALYVLLESGTMTVLYPNTVLLVMQRSYLHFGDNIVNGQVIDDVFVHSDGVEVFQTNIFKLECSYTTNLCRSTPLYGVVALTYLRAEKQILAITENRSFYKIAYCSALDLDDSINSVMNVVDDVVLDQTKTEIVDLIELNRAHEAIRVKISQQIHRMRSMAAVQRALPLTIDVSLARHIPQSKRPLILSSWDDQKATTGSPNYFVHIRINAENVSLNNAIDSFGFPSHDWQLTIHGSHIDCRCVRLFKNNFTEPVHLVYRLNFDSFQIPTLHMNIRNIEPHKFSQSYPIAVPTVCTQDLMTVHSVEPKTNMNESAAKLLLYQLQLPAEVLPTDVWSFFEAGDIEVAASPTSVYVSVMDHHIVQLTLDGQSLIFRANNADALFCVKHHVLSRLQQELERIVRPFRKEDIEEMQCELSALTTKLFVDRDDYATEDALLEVVQKLRKAAGQYIPCFFYFTS